MPNVAINRKQKNKIDILLVFNSKAFVKFYNFFVCAKSISKLTYTHPKVCVF